MSDGHRDFLGKVFPAELDEIERRRQASKVAPLDRSDHQEPTTDLGLTGIAVSGGGIRSASFSLGVIQGLVRKGWFRGADYISTVSGGGYTGSCISSLLNEPHVDADPDDFPLRKDLGEVEGEPLTHLRNGSNYLNPGGLLDRVGLPAVFLRGVILNFLLFLPIIMLAVMLTEWLYEDGPNWHNLRWVALGAMVIFGGLVLLYPFIRSTLGKSFGMRVRQGYRAVVAFFLLVSIVAVALIPLSHIILWAVEKPISTVTQTVGQALDPGDLAKSWPWLLSLTLVAVFMLIGRVSDGASRLSGKMMLTLFGLLGPVLLFAFYILLAALQIDSPYLSAQSMEGVTTRLSGCVAGARAGEDSVAAQANPQMQQLERPACTTPADSALIGAFGDRSIELDPTRAIVTKVDSNTFRLTNGFANDGTVTPITAADTLETFRLVRLARGSFRIYGGRLGLFDGPRDWLFLIAMIATTRADVLLARRQRHVSPRVLSRPAEPDVLVPYDKGR